MILGSSRIQFIIPKEATNLVTNPSMETGDPPTGYTQSLSTIARSAVQSRRGCNSCLITPNTGVEAGMLYALALTNGVQYSFSCDVYDVAGQSFRLMITTTSAVIKASSATWTGTGYWKRRYVTWTADATATFHFYLVREAVASTSIFYTDGWQIEEGPVSTYFDGNSIGFVRGENAYRWNGVGHASTSWRSGQTRSGGTYVNLSTYAKLISIVGLGMAPVLNIGVPSTMGEPSYQNTVEQERHFSLVVNFDASNYATLKANRKGIIDCVSPNKVSRRQPLLIQYDSLDASGLENGETLEIPCLYEGGLEGETKLGVARTAINFKMYILYLVQQGEHGTGLGFATTVTDADYILQRTTAGVWQALAGGSTDSVTELSPAADGGMFMAGNFTDLGDANGDYITKWNGTAFTSLGTGANLAVNALITGPDGMLYAGGMFTQMGGVANTAHLAKWNGSVWAAISTGINGNVWALALGLDGSLYVGGAFTDQGDANGDYIVKWNGSAWVSLGTGMNGDVYALAVGPDGSLYAGGAFTLAGGVSGTAHIAKWNGTAWLPLGSGTNDTVYSIVVGNDGTVYAGGKFTGISQGIAGWDSSGRGGLFYRQDMNNEVDDLYYDAQHNLLYACGLFTTAGGIALPDRMAVWNGSTWMPMDVDLPGTPTIYRLMTDKAGNLYVGFSTSGSATSATVSATTIGNSPIYPKIEFTGPGSLAQIKNYTNGKAIFFDLTLLAGEYATLVLDPKHPLFLSSFRGDIWSTILPGSDINFELLPGVNNISAYYYAGTTGASAIKIVWRDRYDGIDAAVR